MGDVLLQVKKRARRVLRGAVFTRRLLKRGVSMVALSRRVSAA